VTSFLRPFCAVLILDYYSLIILSFSLFLFFSCSLVGIPEVKRFETSRYVIFNSVRQGFATAYDNLVLDPALRGKGWEIALQIWPDSIMDQLPAHILVQMEREREEQQLREQESRSEEGEMRLRESEEDDTIIEKAEETEEGGDKKKKFNMLGWLPKNKKRIEEEEVIVNDDDVEVSYLCCCGAVYFVYLLIAFYSGILCYRFCSLNSQKVLLATEAAQLPQPKRKALIGCVIYSTSMKYCYTLLRFESFQ
jgi:hypothetical protein